MYKQITHAVNVNVLQKYCHDSSFILKKAVPHSTMSNYTVNILLEDQNKDSKLMQRIKMEHDLIGDWIILIHTECYAGSWEEEDFTLMINKEVYIDESCTIQKCVKK